jgi:hypothetical protein
MKVSLNKANKLRALLENAVGQLYVGQREFAMVSLNGFEDFETVEAKIDANIEANAALIDKIERGTTAIFTLRNLIQKRNADFGINDVISDIAKTNELIKVYSNLDQRPANFAREIPTANVVKSNSEFRSQSTAATTNYSGRTALPFSGVSSVDKATQEAVQNKHKALKKALRELEEKRNELNHQNILDIPAEVELVLTENDLI